MQILWVKSILIKEIWRYPFEYYLNKKYLYCIFLLKDFSFYSNCLPPGYGQSKEICNMSSIRTRLSTPVQIFILIFYLVLVLFVKHIYDNNQRSHRFVQYNIMVRDVAYTLDMVERHAKETAQAAKAIEAAIKMEKEVIPEHEMIYKIQKNIARLSKSHTT